MLDGGENYIIKKNEEICEEIIIPLEIIDDIENSNEKQVKEKDINGKQVLEEKKELIQVTSEIN